MKRPFAIMALVALAATARAAQEPELKTLKQKASYCIGLNIGAQLRRARTPVEAASLARGIMDALSGAKAALTDQQIRATMLAFKNQLQERQTMLAEQNKKEGEAFLAANGAKQGVKALPSGLQYKVIEAGTGPKPKLTDTVVTHYKGTLIDGTEFDSSHRRGKPATFPVNRVIDGWTEALQLMRVGATWQLFVPGHLAYGPTGSGGTIGPNATLIFEVKLLEIK